jgi:hypothetical protein
LKVGRNWSENVGGRKEAEQERKNSSRNEIDTNKIK